MSMRQSRHPRRWASRAVLWYGALLLYTNPSLQQATPPNTKGHCSSDRTRRTLEACREARVRER
ncbi:hypothetical protein MUK42_20675 [Musa troglodytarum]|uniref:Secreted protein n=1 Tax=Musa troglodytarum TaxID=320322 RepID=A0A9E7FSX2_9LILI|nr:hypothetical protein MUK42_20675 [Musa troglodytarum]URE02356.1 hypothetical protein MUK42_20675 [Musa troglodytarum]